MRDGPAEAGDAELQNDAQHLEREASLTGQRFDRLVRDIMLGSQKGSRRSAAVGRLRTRAARDVLTLACVLLVAGIGVSRVALGIHFSGDVLGGFAAGGFWLAACITGIEVMHHKRRD